MVFKVSSVVPGLESANAGRSTQAHDASASLADNALRQLWTLDVRGQAARFQLSKSVNYTVPIQQHTLVRSSPFASVSLLLGRLSGAHRWRRLFDLIDTDRNGRLSEAELESYARSNGLPTIYVKNFFTLLASSPNSSIDAERLQEVNYHSFRSFVTSREAALKRAFSLFDKDKDGKISFDDLDATLAHVIIHCPKTRCIYRTHRQAAAHLFKQAAAKDSDGLIEFSQFRDFYLLLPQTDMIVEFWMKAGRCPDLDSKVMMHDQGEKARASPWGHLFAGAVAGAASRTATAPLETLRLAVMTGSMETSCLAQGLMQIIQRHGWRGLYRGNAVNVLRSAPQKALDFFAFSELKRIIGDDSYAAVFAAAGLAGMLSWSALYPLEVVRSRITTGAQLTGNVLQAMASIAKAEGPKALYKGLGWSIAAILPEASITYGLHDTLKRVYKQLCGGDEPGVLPSLAFGVTAAFMGQLVAFPLETISRRLQVAHNSAKPMEVVREMWSQGGPKALYRGVGAATLRLVPMAVVSFGTYELVRAILMQLETLQDESSAEQDYQQLRQYVRPLSKPLDMPVLRLSSDGPPTETVAMVPVGNASVPVGAVASSGIVPSLEIEGVGKDHAPASSRAE